MPTPSKRPIPDPPTSPTYAAVPNPGRATPETSPNPDDPYSSLGGANLPHSAFLSPEGADSALLGGRRDSATYPAPSIMSRDSTHASLPGTPSHGDDHRASWGSGANLAAAAGGIAGAEAGRRPGATRGQSNLAHSTLGWNNLSNDRLSTSDEDDGQGHITPAAAAGPALTAGLNEKYPRWANDAGTQGYAVKKSRKGLWIGLGVGGALILVALGVGLGIGLTRNKSNTTGTTSSDASTGGSSASSSGNSASGTGTATASGSAASATPTTGSAGSVLTFADGTTMVYNNTFGGKWVWDPANPFNNDAQAQSYTPALSSNWTWGINKVYGVNLGGWLNTEPFIVSGMYEKYATGPNNQTAVDEYTLSQNMGSNLTAAMTEHYETFITERDIAEIAMAGLNWVRIPLPHWAIETTSEEPYLEHVAWDYFLLAIQWCRKYGIRINLDFHTIPGSQNGWNHSGKLGSINWLNGAMGLANAQRALDYIRTLAQFIAQPEYAPVIQMFGFINEPNANALGKAAVGSFYLEAYKIVREVTGIGEGRGPMLSVHDGFLGISNWYGFAPGADRLALDQHSYMIFVDQAQGTFDSISHLPCSWWANSTNTTSKTWGVNVAGEWSAASNDCGLWINNVGAGSRYDGTLAGYTGPTPGSCTFWNDYTLWNATTIADLLHFTLASMDALQNYFFWTWKIGNSTGSIAEVNPFWHYRLGLQHGWIPKDPRQAVGICAGDGVTGDDFSGTFSSAWMTGGAGAGEIAATMSSSYPWPPVSFTSVASASMSLLPQYTQTKAPITMSGPTFTSPGSTATINAGNGWYNANDVNRQAYAPVAGCSYPPEYNATTVSLTKGMCGAGLTQAVKKAEMPRATAPPS